MKRSANIGKWAFAIVVGGVTVAWFHSASLRRPATGSTSADRRAAVVSPPTLEQPARLPAGLLQTQSELVGVLAALASAHAVADPIARVDAIDCWASHIPLNRVPEVLAQLETQDLFNDPGVLLLQHWAKTNPTAAAAWVAKQDKPAMRRELIPTVALTWAETAVADALRWAWSLPDSEEVVPKETLREMAGNDLELALPLTAAQPASPANDELLLSLLSDLSLEDPNATYEWLRQWPAGPAQRRTLAGFAIGLAPEYGALAMEIATTDLPPGAEKDWAYLGVVESWGRIDPVAATAWVKNFTGPAAMKARLVGVLPPETP